MMPISAGATQEAGAPIPASTEEPAGREPDAGSATAIAAIERHDTKAWEETARRVMRLVFSRGRRPGTPPLPLHAREIVVGPGVGGSALVDPNDPVEQLQGVGLLALERVAAD